MSGFSQFLNSVSVTGQTEDTTPDGAADYLLTHDASAAALKKILLHRATAFKVGSFTRDTSTASGTQAVTGVGFQPKAIIFLASVSTSTRQSAGFSDGSGEGSLYNAYGLTVGAWNPVGLAIRMLTNGSDIYDGAVSALGSDGFTITWTKSGSPTGTATIYYLALR